MVKAEAFLAIEQTLAAKLYLFYRKHMGKVFGEIQDLISRGEYVQALEAAQRISLAEVFDDAEPAIRYFTHVAMLFGASRVTTRAKINAVSMGAEKLTVSQIVLSFMQSLVFRGSVALQDAAVQLIADKLAQKSDMEGADLQQGGLKTPDRMLPRKHRKKRVAKAVNMDDRFVRDFESFMNYKGKEFFNIVSSLHTSRVSAYGFTAEANALGLTEYAISEQLDTRTCPVCRRMHGKVFKVSDARALLGIVIRATEPEDLKQLQPWPKQDKASLAALDDMTSEQIVEKGWHIPPYHPRCRGLLTRVGKVPDLEKPQEPLDNYEATSEDFQAFGITPTAMLVAEWNRRAKVAPSEFLARMSGQSHEKVLTEADGFRPTWMKKLELVHVEEAAVGAAEAEGGAGIEVRTYSKFFQSADYADIYYFLGSASLLTLVNMSVTEKDVPYFRNLMMNMLGLALDAEAQAISLMAGEEEFGSSVGGYAWAQYGFVPTPEGWESIKQYVSDMLPSMALGELEALAVEKILQSNDPSMVFGLASLEHGRDYLSGPAWAGVLNLSDETAMSQFLAYMS